MYLTPEEREIGKLNFLSVLADLRGDFLEQSIAPVGKGLGERYFEYGKLDGAPVRAGIVGTGNEGCEAMIMQSPPDYLRFVAYHDIRPSQIGRAPKKFETLYGPEEAKGVKFHEKWEEMLANPDLEAIVVATPLWTHARLTIEALEAGKHVLCEKLMAHNITDAKAMVRAAQKSGKILAIGHQRHYSTLYDNALAVVRSGVLGDIKHIRALWHRNNTWLAPDGKLHDGWSPPIPDLDLGMDYRAHGYKSLEELVRWRLYNRTGGGLMAELGSHQLDACSLFLGKVHPLRVNGVGGKYYFTDDRECDDHVYCSYEMPGGVVVTYSSINTNAQEGYGEIVMGTKGTLMVLNEADVMLFKEREPSDGARPEEMRLAAPEGPDGKRSLAWVKSPSLSPGAAMAKLALERDSWFTPAGMPTRMTNRGYQQEMEAFAHAIRNPGAKVRCDGVVALADAVMALVANVAMRDKRQIEFKDSWYDPNSDEVPDSPASNSLAG